MLDGDWSSDVCSSDLDTFLSHSSLSADGARKAFDLIFTGQVPHDQMSLFLRKLHEKGETSEEILGAAQSMRSHAVTIQAPKGAIDIVGTGGDGHGTLNISTAAALVVAACGVPVAKHGNRAATSKSGSSDVLATLGLNLDAPMENLEQSLSEANLCFMFAPRHHPAMRHVADVRRKLGIRTIFNLLGPLTNPAGVKRHLIGVYDKKWLKPMAKTLGTLGSTSAWIVNARDGMDELTTTSPCDVATMETGSITTFTLTPKDAGMRPATLHDIKGGTPVENAGAILRLLEGEKSPYRDVVVFNAAAALVIADKAADLKAGAALAQDTIDSKAARATLDKVIDLSRRGNS
jgi:anthranilate phosphoribosyltransferase